MKAEPRWLIPRMLTENLELLIVHRILSNQITFVKRYFKLNLSSNSNWTHTPNHLNLQTTNQTLKFLFRNFCRYFDLTRAVLPLKRFTHYNKKNEKNDLLNSQLVKTVWRWQKRRHSNNICQWEKNLLLANFLCAELLATNYQVVFCFDNWSFNLSFFHHKPLQTPAAQKQSQQNFPCRFWPTFGHHNAVAPLSPLWTHLSFFCRLILICANVSRKHSSRCLPGLLRYVLKLQVFRMFMRDTDNKCAGPGLQAKFCSEPIVGFCR